MRYLLVSILTLAVVASMLLGCAPGVKDVPVPITVSCDDFRAEKSITKEVQLAAGNKIVVNLCQQSGSTGYSWPEKAQLSNPQVLEQVGFKTIQAEKPMPGAPGNNEWTFKALQPGKCVVDLQYSRPWQGGEKGEWILKLNVNVK